MVPTLPRSSCAKRVYLRTDDTKWRIYSQFTNPEIFRRSLFWTKEQITFIMQKSNICVRRTYFEYKKFITRYFKLWTPQMKYVRFCTVGTGPVTDNENPWSVDPSAGPVVTQVRTNAEETKEFNPHIPRDVTPLHIDALWRIHAPLNRASIH